MKSIHQPHIVGGGGEGDMRGRGGGETPVGHMTVNKRVVKEKLGELRWRGSEKRKTISRRGGDRRERNYISTSGSSCGEGDTESHRLAKERMTDRGHYPGEGKVARSSPST